MSSTEGDIVMSFTDEEIAYIRSQPLARLATVGSDGQPDVVPVGITLEGPYIYISGLDNARTHKYRNVRDGNEKVSLVIDDLLSIQPWTPRFVRIYNTADIEKRDSDFGQQPYLRITPTTSWSWNLEGRPFMHDGNGASFETLRKTVHTSSSQG